MDTKKNKKQWKRGKLAIRKEDEIDEMASVLEETMTRGASAGRKCQKRRNDVPNSGRII